MICEGRWHTVSGDRDRAARLKALLDGLERGRIITAQARHVRAMRFGGGA